MTADGSTGIVTGRSVLRPVPWLRTAEFDGSVTMLSGSRVVRYSGGATRLLSYVLPMLDGRADVETIVDELGVSELVEPAIALCRRLLADGLVREVHEVSADSGERTVQLFDALAGVGPAGPAHVYLCGSDTENDAVAGVAPEHWRPSAVALTALADQRWEEHACAIVWVSDMNDPELAEWNELAYRRRLPWLAISHFDGEAAVVGPYVEPPQTACFECYRRRRASHNPAGGVALLARPVAALSLTTRAITQVLAALGVAMVHEWTARRSAFVPGAIRTVTFDEGMQVGTEYVLRVPRCAACRPVPSAGRLAPWSEFFADTDANSPL